MSAESPLRDGIAPGFTLIETLRWEPETGFMRLEQHLARLAASATTLGLRHDPVAARAALEGTVEGAAGPQRVRLTLAADGAVEVTTQPFQPLPDGIAWILCLARTRLSSQDALLRHKTSRRDAYQAARAEYTTADADEVLLANERGEICEGTITNLFVDTGNGGPLLTPALMCGLLPGILRGEFLDQGRAREAVLTLDDLIAAKQLYVGNSLRGLIAAKLGR
ncbi:aminotransferase class IV family protein [Mesorhizobium sp. NPDC059054]|uniref:aminotransferase class IV family protein n=1 Tax=Mesorhizobium sp. NPDC059054 TaxID=3346711 RepID=UPI003674DC16